ncbi:phytanoyl-CoA dioxygenase, putative [Bodo saltans]|uniref:Phytanoyl-CoA dioxygenase, putative n=1 Tax=Bodo saltans TaxID=75058 RepID=A0A0S4IN71_BODSA|nr:phytanoyl-CoA dioxygenase, putative [Bodo saltans]|eukprot:CUE77903.1 phytanoyl-CoA dioxygenase, putative [Bodo saltans]
MEVRDPFAATLNADGVALRQADLTKNGFTIFSTCCLHDWSLVEAREHLQSVFQGVYDRGTAPPKPLTNVDSQFTFSSPPNPGGSSSKRIRTQHIINIWHCDSYFHSFATSKALGKLVAQVCGWEHRGCRLAQDQVWVKPPGAGALSFHRDTTYFDFLPKEVATVWFTFDATDGSDGTQGEQLGPLEYCRGSHLWSLARRGSASQFFDPDYHAMLRDAAQRELAAGDGSAWAQECARDLQVSKVLAEAGGFSIHNGNTWHGSGPNVTNQYRRGIGLHFIPGDVVFNLADVGTLWRPYVDPEGSSQLPEKWFPWVHVPSD